MSWHTRGGNCWAYTVIHGCQKCGTDNVCDVCHEHDEPRGSCSECSPCAACEES